MFGPGSRYRNLPQLTSIDAQGGRQVSTGLRLIPHTSGQFLHTVNAYDRLDLLAFKYYSDATRWWQISDANPEFPFPLDLLDRSPLVEEALSLVSPDNSHRFQNLLAAVNAAGQVRSASNTFVLAQIVATFAAAAVRQQIISAIGANGFQFLGSFSWSSGNAEAFTLEDRTLKTNWRAMLERLRAMAGVVEWRSMLDEATIHVIYNEAIVDRSAILSAIVQTGFAVSPLTSQRVERLGAKVVIPPNGTA